MWDVFLTWNTKFKIKSIMSMAHLCIWIEDRPILRSIPNPALTKHSYKSLFQFKSYCSSHRPVQKVKHVGSSRSLGKTDVCSICQEEVSMTPSPKSIWTPCCGAYFHPACIQSTALSAGAYHFRWVTRWILFKHIFSSLNLLNVIKLLVKTCCLRCCNKTSELWVPVEIHNSPMFVTKY